MTFSILFVCLGNICRSPTAEQIFRDMVIARGIAEKFHIDSAGTGDWHIGHAPDSRAQETALTHGYDLSKLTARLVTVEDFQKFDLIIAMDKANIQRLQSIEGCQIEKIKLLLDYLPDSDITDVPDPYFGDVNDFEQTLALIEQSCVSLIDDITKAQ